MFENCTCSKRALATDVSVKYHGATTIASVIYTGVSTCQSVTVHCRVVYTVYTKQIAAFLPSWFRSLWTRKSIFRPPESAESVPSKIFSIFFNFSTLLVSEKSLLNCVDVWKEWNPRVMDSKGVCQCPSSRKWLRCFFQLFCAERHFVWLYYSWWWRLSLPMEVFSHHTDSHSFPSLDGEEGRRVSCWRQSTGFDRFVITVLVVTVW